MQHCPIPPEIHSFTAGQLPPLVDKTFANGLRLHTLVAGDQPVMRLSMYWEAGPSLEFGPGVATIATEMLREGCREASSEQIAELLDFCGAEYDASANDHFCCINLTVHERNAAQILPVLRSMIVNPTFPQREFEVVKVRAAANLRMTDSRVLQKAAKALAKLIKGPKNPLAIYTEPEHVEALAIDDVRRFHAKVFAAKCCHVYLGGNISPEMLVEVEAMLASLPRGEGFPICLYPFEPEPPQTVYTDVPDAVQAAIDMAIPTIGREHPDYLPLHLTVMALGGYFGSRLMTNIREEKGYTYGINASLNGALDGAMVNITANCDARYIEAVIAETKSEMERMAQCPPRGDELERLRRYAMMSLLNTQESPLSILAYYACELLVGTPKDYFEQRQRLIMTMEPEQYALMARKYLLGKDLRISIASKQ